MFAPLYDPHPLRVISTRQLRDEIAAHRLRSPPAVGPKRLKRVTAFDRWGGEVQPFDILHLLGRALTPVIPTGWFEESSRWALYRYFWAFAPAVAGQPLRLSAEASKLVDHHRTLASEQLGIGMTLLLGRWLVEARHPAAAVDYADADIAVDRGYIDPAGNLIVSPVANNRRMRPDYFFTAEEPSGDVTVYAIESKGTHTAGHYRQQMRKGASQVASLKAKGKVPTGFVFSTELSSEEILVRVLDPEDRSGAWSGPLADRSDADAAASSGQERPLVGWSAEGPRTVRDPAQLRRAIIETARASLLAFAGQYTAAAERLPRQAQASDVPALPDFPTTSIENNLGSFEVVEAALPLGCARVRVRAGLHADALTALREHDEAGYAEIRTQLAAAATLDRDAHDGTQHSSSTLELDEGGRGIRSLTTTGSYLEVLAE